MVPGRMAAPCASFGAVPNPPVLPSAGRPRSPVDDALARLLAEARVADATAGRARGRWLRQQSDEEATLLAVLVDLGEAGTPVVVGVRGRGPTPGTITTVGADVVVVRTTVGDLVVPVGSLGWVRAEPGSTVPVGGRRIDAPVSLASLLVELAADRPAVAVGSVDGARHVGDLRAVGRDVVRVVDPARPGAGVVIPLGAVTEVLLTHG